MRRACAVPASSNSAPDAVAGLRVWIRHPALAVRTWACRTPRRPSTATLPQPASPCASPAFARILSAFWSPTHRIARVALADFLPMPASSKPLHGDTSQIRELSSGDSASHSAQCRRDSAEHAQLVHRFNDEPALRQLDAAGPQRLSIAGHGFPGSPPACARPSRTGRRPWSTPQRVAAVDPVWLLAGRCFDTATAACRKGGCQQACGDLRPASRGRCDHCDGPCPCMFDPCSGRPACCQASMPPRYQATLR